MAAVIWRIRGMTFSDLSELSVRKSCMPPMPSAGRMAIAVAMIPMPPIHCRSARHSSIPGGAFSSPVMTVPPVVVMPDTASKKASAMLRLTMP